MNLRGKENFPGKEDTIQKDKEAELKSWESLIKAPGFGSYFLKLGAIKSVFARNAQNQLLINEM